ncbi:MAG: hypothetical protein JNK49_10145 [Planctomycetes bacterium]|nr:hypothetical protein [Planctomycetota bacterium]
MRMQSLVSTFLLAGAASAQIASGNLVVLRVGAGANPLSSAAQAMFLDEYTTSGALVQSLALPTAANGAQLPIACSGSASSEGNLQLSPDGRWLTCAGYATAPGLASVASSAAAVTPRVVARIGLDGSIDTSTSISNAFSGNNVRSAATANGTDFFVAGANSGINHVVLGAGTASALHVTNPQNTRTVAIWNQQLYCSSSAQGFHSVSQVGTGVSTAGGQTVTALLGLPATSSASPYDFFFADAQTLYIADDRTAGGLGGIQKYVESAGAWQFQYTLNPATTIGCRGLTGTVANGVVTLYCTTTTTSTNSLLAIVDTGPTATFTTLATAGTNTVFRGVRLTTPSNYVTRIPHGCGNLTLNGIGDASLGTSFVTTLGGATGLGFIGYGFVAIPQPLCGACTIGHEWAAPLFGTSSSFNIPQNQAFVGITIAIQGADGFGLGGCQVPQVVLSDTLTITLH